MYEALSYCVCGGASRDERDPPHWQAAAADAEGPSASLFLADEALTHSKRAPLRLKRSLGLGQQDNKQIILLL